MSIAISAEIKPSRIFSILYLGFAALFLLAAILIRMGQTGNFASVHRQLLALLLCLTAFFFVFSYFWSRKTLWIDISGNGQIRLKEDKRSVSKPSSENADSPSFNETWELSENSTVWPTLLILQLKTENGKKAKVLICQDSVKEEQFKSLYTSVRWIEAHRKNALKK